MKVLSLCSALFFCLALSPLACAQQAAPLEPVSTVCADEHEAREYLDGILEEYPSSITIRMRRSPSKSVIRKLKDCFLGSGYSNRYSYTCMNDKVTFIPEYTDWAYMRGVFLNILDDSVLTGKMAQAYAQALEIAGEVKASVAQEELPPGVSQEYMLALALHNWVCTHAVYKLCYKKNPSEAVTNMVLKGQGVCEGYTRLYSILLTMCGVENHYISGKAKGQSHAWNMVKLDGEWVHVDVTWDDPGKDKNSAPHHQYFGMSDEMISADHKWNRKRSPAATTNELHYSNVME